jgi:hypothetical protein
VTRCATNCKRRAGVAFNVQLGPPTSTPALSPARFSSWSSRHSTRSLRAWYPQIHAILDILKTGGAFSPSNRNNPLPKALPVDTKVKILRTASQRGDVGKALASKNHASDALKRVLLL